MSAKNIKKSKTRNKIEFFSKLLNYFPYCSKIVMMTSTTAEDVLQLYNAKKITKGISIVNYENLKSKHWNVGANNQHDFLLQWNARMREIFGSDSNRRKTLFKDIFSSSLVKDAGRNNQLVLIDSCRKWNNSIAIWAGSDDTVESLVDDGILGINVMISRTIIEGDTKPFSHNVRIIQNDGYKNQNEEYAATRSMYIIANAIEKSSNGRLETVAMMNYWDDARSPMVYILFRKTNSHNN